LKELREFADRESVPLGNRVEPDERFERRIEYGTFDAHAADRIRPVEHPDLLPYCLADSITYASVDM